jgi:SAM-dependent methyltransferase
MPDRLTHRPGTFQLVKCERCGLIYQNPRLEPQELEAYYPDDYESYYRETKESLSWLQWKLLEYGLRKRARLLLQRQNAGRLLDVGCATGHFLYYVREHSHWQVQGVEPNHTAAQFAEETFHLDVYRGGLHEAKFPDNYFDAVTMWDVLEHVEEPVAIMEEVWRILKPGGAFLVRLPIADSLDAKLFGQYWSGLDQPRHLSVFSRSSLHRLLESVGFTPIESVSIAGSYSAFMISLRFAIEDTFGRNRLTSGLLRVLSSMPVRLLTAVLFFMIDRLGWGPQLAVLCEKDTSHDS